MIGFLSTGSQHSVSPDGLPSLQGEKAVTYLKQQGLYSSLAEAMQAARYKVYQTIESQQSGEPFYADNPAQGYSAKFGPDGMHLVLSDKGGQRSKMSMRLHSYGYGNRQIVVLPGRLTSEGNRVEIARELGSRGAGEQRSRGAIEVVKSEPFHPRTPAPLHPCIEWYVNRPDGLEQGFTISERPGGGQAGEPLSLAMEVRGDLSPEANGDGRCVVMRDQSGKVALRYSGLKVWDATERELRAELSVRGRRVSIEVEEDGAIYPLTIDPVIDTEVAKIQASDRKESAAFGGAVSISGDTAIVGAVFDLDGAAYIFERNVGGINNWGEVKKLVASDIEADDRFGGSVSISGDTAIVGAALEDAGGNRAGAAYIFERNAGGANNWGEVTKLLSSDIEADDLFGGSVSISGDTAIVGARSESTGGMNAGAAYIFERNQGGVNNWGEVTKLLSSDIAAGDAFSASVSINGDTAIVGATFQGGSDGGAAYIFERNQGGANNWGEVKKIVSSDREASDFFGDSVSISGDTVIVSAGGEDTGGDGAGAVYIFERNQGGANNWGEVIKLLASDPEANDSFGSSVSISGDTATVGAVNEDTGGVNAGAAYIFERNAGGANNWGEVIKLLASDPEANDSFGSSVSVSGDTAIVGAPIESTGGGAAGAAYLFVPAANAFTVCIEDDSNPANSIRLITVGSQKGTYVLCCGGQIFTGKGTIGIKNGVLNLVHFTPTRRVQAYVYMNQMRGSASVQSPPFAFPCVISDSDITDNTCNCP